MLSGRKYNEFSALKNQVEAEGSKIERKVVVILEERNLIDLDVHEIHKETEKKRIDSWKVDRETCLPSPSG